MLSSDHRCIAFVGPWASRDSESCVVMSVCCLFHPHKDLRQHVCGRTVAPRRACTPPPPPRANSGRGMAGVYPRHTCSFKITSDCMGAGRRTVWTDGGTVRARGAAGGTAQGGQRHGGIVWSLRQADPINSVVRFWC